MPIGVARRLDGTRRVSGARQLGSAGRPSRVEPVRGSEWLPRVPPECLGRMNGSAAGMQTIPPGVKVTP